MTRDAILPTTVQSRQGAKTAKCRIHFSSYLAALAPWRLVHGSVFVPMILMFAGTAWGHHTRDHLVLGQDASEVIAATREGGHGWLLWGGLVLLLFLGLVRWWVGRSRR